MEDTASNAVKLVGEVFVPGASQLIEGKIGSGAGHFIVGGILVAALAPLSPLIAALAGVGVRLNSFHNSVYGTSLWSDVHVQVDHPSRKAAAK